VKDQLLQAAQRAAPERRLNVGREYLQVYLLRLMHEAGAHERLAFLGGAALRLLHGLPRFSEDLDFSAAPGKAAPEPADLFRALKAELENAGYGVAVRLRAERTAANAFFRFAGLPRELGWSRDPRLSLSVKIEIDRRPPAAARVETTLVQRFFPIALRHHDLPSLFAGKIHALLARRYPKGRDWFDLAWYLTEKRGIEPNLELLGNALAQTGHPRRLAARWRAEVRKRMDSLSWSALASDVSPFLERPGDLGQMSRELIQKLL
jgi:predicted nucleotidyltransferase component of viral defense system